MKKVNKFAQFIVPNFQFDFFNDNKKLNKEKSGCKTRSRFFIPFALYHHLRVKKTFESKNKFENKEKDIHRSLCYLITNLNTGKNIKVIRFF